MSVMDRDRWLALEPLLDEVLELPRAEQAGWLASLDTVSPDVLADLRQLLSEDDAADRRGFLQHPVSPSQIGTRVGAYVLERPLGRGGMGSVWFARRTDGRFDGVAAVKLLDMGLFTESGQARFRREGSALARITHPGIAHLLDAGVSASGQPYLVLEYVSGVPIDEFVQARVPSRRERVRLFLQVLDAVGHAHTRLIVHRDLKPSNILVSDDGAVKLLDFGIAKLLDEEDGVTTRERLAPLTPAFAAPEQIRGEAVSTATDTYSLGVLLYVLLSGRHPTTAGCNSPTEALHAMLERDPAPLGLGDLDFVLGRALRRPACERYQSVTTFADDLRRWLAHQPIGARSSSLVYRTGRLLRRHRVGALVSGACAAMAVAGMAMVLDDRARVRDALAEATTNARRAESVSEFTVGLFEGAGPGPAYSDSVSAGELLTRAEARAHELRGQPAIQAQMLDLIGRIRTQLGDYAGARPVLQEALALRRRALGNDHPDVATSLMNTAVALEHDEGRSEEVVPMLREALALRRRHFGDGDPRTTDALYALAMDLHSTGAYAAARPLLDEWISRVRQQPPQITRTRSEQLATLGKIAQFSGPPARAESLLRSSLALERALYGDGHDRVAIAYTNLGGILTDEHRTAESEPLLRSAAAILRRNHPDGHVELAATLRNLGYALGEMGRWTEAEAVWREVASLYGRFGGARSLGYANAMSYLGHTRTERGDAADGERVLRATLDLPVMGTTLAGPVVLRTRRFLGQALQRQGRVAEAEPLLVEAYRASAGSRLARRAHESAARSLVTMYESSGRPGDAARYR